MARVGAGGMAAAVLLAGALLGAGCASTCLYPSPSEAVIGGGESVLPVRWYGDMPVVEAFIDGKGPYSFIIDTGTSYVLVSRTVAGEHDEVTIESDEPLTMTTPSGTSVVSSKAIPVESFRMGTSELRDFGALVVDLEFLSDSVGFRVDGILGWSACSGCLLTLDYPRREVRFSEGELPAIDGRTVLPLADDGIPHVDIEWRGKPITVVLDSGSNGGIKLRVWPEGAEFLFGPVWSGHSATVSEIMDRGACARVGGSVSLGPLRILDPQVCLAPGSPRVGTEVFGEMCVTLDKAHGKVRFAHGPVEWRDTPLRGTGASIVPFRGVFKVLGVLHDSPADKAGVKVGDIVLVWDGIPADAEHQAELVFREGSGATSERMTLRRDGKEFEVELPIVDIVP